MKLFQNVLFNNDLAFMCFLCVFITRSCLTKEHVTISWFSLIHAFTMSSVIYVIALVGFCFGNPGGSFTVLTSVVVSSLTYS